MWRILYVLDWKEETCFKGNAQSLSSNTKQRANIICQTRLDLELDFGGSRMANFLQIDRTGEWSSLSAQIMEPTKFSQTRMAKGSNVIECQCAHF